MCLGQIRKAAAECVTCLERERCAAIAESRASAVDDQVMTRRQVSILIALDEDEWFAPAEIRRRVVEGRGGGVHSALQSGIGWGWVEKHETRYRLTAKGRMVLERSIKYYGDMMRAGEDIINQFVAAAVADWLYERRDWTAEDAALEASDFIVKRSGSRGDFEMQSRLTEYLLDRFEKREKAADGT